MTDQEELGELIRRYRARGGYVKTWITDGLISGVSLRQTSRHKHTGQMPLIEAAERMREMIATPLLYQIHHEDIASGESKMIAQRDFDDCHEQFRQWFKDVESRHPLPEGKRWMVCNQGASKFVTAAQA